MNRIINMFKTFFILFFRPIKGQTHSERLEDYFSSQTEGYDATRVHILPGRDQLYSLLAKQQPATWFDYGGGTGANFEAVHDQLIHSQIHILDLSLSMLGVAKKRSEAKGWKNIHLHQADIEKPQGKPNEADVATLSYSLSMTKHWYNCLTSVKEKLKDHGFIGVVDFYVADKHEMNEELKQNWFYRHVVPLFFIKDNVFLKADYQMYLRSQFEVIHFEKRTHRYPYTPFKIDYFIFIGKK